MIALIQSWSRFFYFDRGMQRLHLCPPCHTPLCHCEAWASSAKITNGPAGSLVLLRLALLLLCLGVHLDFYPIDEFSLYIISKALKGTCERVVRDKIAFVLGHIEGRVLCSLFSQTAVTPYFVLISQ